MSEKIKGAVVPKKAIKVLENIGEKRKPLVLTNKRPQKAKSRFKG